MSKFATATYLFVHYAVVTSYMASGGEYVALFVSKLVPSPEFFSLPPSLSPMVYGAATFAPMLLLPEKTMAAINNLLVLAALASFLAIISFGLPTVDTAILQLPETLPPLSTVAPPIPVFLLTLVFHNVIPTVSRLLDYDPKAIRSAISLGSVVPFLLFLLYNFTILGNVGVVADLGAAAASSLDPIAILQSRAGDNPLLPTLVEGFCLLAITTSLVGFVEGLKTIYNPMFSGESGIFPAAVVENKERAIAVAIAVPPVAAACYDPGISLPALEFGALYGVTSLFLVIPALMASKVRKSGDFRSSVGAEVDGEYEGRLIPWTGGVELAGLLGVAGIAIASSFVR